MSLMTLNDAIKHLEENVETKTDWCEECKQEHAQLLAWLVELRDCKVQLEVANKCIRDSETYLCALGSPSFAVRVLKKYLSGVNNNE